MWSQLSCLLYGGIGGHSHGGMGAGGNCLSYLMWQDRGGGGEPAPPAVDEAPGRDEEVQAKAMGTEWAVAAGGIHVQAEEVNPNGTDYLRECS